MALAPFGEWLPDQVAFGNPGLVGATNVLPAPGGQGYLPFPSLRSTTSSLPGPPRGGILAELPGATYVYRGTPTAIYMLSSGGWVDVSRPGGYALGQQDRWEFVQFQNRIIAACGASSALQVAGVGGDGFEDLPTSARRPRAKRIGLVNGFPVLGHTYDDQDGEQPSRLWWPQLVQLVRPEIWDPDLTTQANYTVSVPQAGDGSIMHIKAGVVGVIICERAIYRMRYVNLPQIFEFDRIATGRGCVAPGAAIDVGNTTFFIDQDGLYSTDGNDVSPIGHGKVDRTIAARLNKAALNTIVSAIMPDRSVAMWLLPLDSADRPSHALAYAWKEGRFSLGEVGGSFIGETAEPGMSFDQEPWSEAALALPPWGDFAWDAPEFSGGQRALSVIDHNGGVWQLSGPGLPAVLRTQEVAPSFPNVTEVTGVHPVIEGADGARVRVGTRHSITQPVTWGQFRGLNMVGYAQLRARGTYLMGEIELPDGFVQAIGLDFDSRKAGRR